MSDSKQRVFHAGPEGTVADDKRDGADPGKTPDLTERTVREMTFSTHVISLNAMAMMYLGQIEGGETDRDGAQHMIDTLAMLREKTQGNLTADEARLLDSILYDLRLKFVELG